MCCLTWERRELALVVDGEDAGEEDEVESLGGEGMSLRIKKSGVVVPKTLSYSYYGVLYARFLEQNVSKGGWMATYLCTSEGGSAIC